MSHVVVFNSSARTVRVNTTPGKYLTEVLDEACQKFGLKRDQYTLKYNNKPITLSQQIRFANLAQGARLELVQASRSPTVISVALQLPASEKSVRLTQKFASNTSLWTILRQFESALDTNHNFTQRGIPELASNGASGAGRLNYEMPVITVMPGHKEYATFVDLQKTLAQLGFDSGSALLRLNFKNSGEPLEAVMTQISQFFQSSDVNSATTANKDPPQAPGTLDTLTQEVAHTDGSSNEQSTRSETTPMDIDESSETGITTETSTETAPVPVDDERVVQASPPTPHPLSTPAHNVDIAGTSRNLRVFAASASNTPQAARQAYNEADYVPTVEHAKSHQASLNTRSRNTRLLSDKELDEQASVRQARIDEAAAKGGLLRVRFPDGSIIESSITKADTSENIYELVSSCLERKQEPFWLQYRGPLGRPVRLEKDKKRVFQDLGFTNSELITFLWDDGASQEVRREKNVLSAEWQQKAVPLTVEEPTIANETGTAPDKQQDSGSVKKKSDMTPEEKENKLKSLFKNKLFKSGGKK